MADESLFIQQGQHKVEFRLDWTDEDADLSIRENGSSAKVMLRVDHVVLYELADQLNLWAEMLEAEHELEPSGVGFTEPPYPDQDPATEVVEYCPNCHVPIEECLCDGNDHDDE